MRVETCEGFGVESCEGVEDLEAQDGDGAAGVGAQRRVGLERDGDGVARPRERARV